MIVADFYRDVATGLLPGGLRFCRFGRGAETLIVIPGIDDSVHDFQWVPRLWAWYFRPLAAARRVVVLSRPRGLDPSVSTESLAGTYANALAERFGPTDVLGISMGGMIAQHLAARRPQLVRRLVLAVTAHRAGPEADRHGEALAELANGGRWQEFLLRANGICFSKQRRFALPLWLGGHAMFGRRRVAAHDFSVSARACTRHDATSVLAQIEAPTLVWAARGDQLFPLELAEEMTRRIPRATLCSVRGPHAAFLEQRGRFHRAIVAFLDKLPLPRYAERLEPRRAPATVEQHAVA